MRIHDALEEFLLVLEGNGRSLRSISIGPVGGLIAWLAPADDVAAITPNAGALPHEPGARGQRRGRERKPGARCVGRA
jgi:hypothetical protein